MWRRMVTQDIDSRSAACSMVRNAAEVRCSGIAGVCLVVMDAS